MSGIEKIWGYNTWDVFLQTKLSYTGRNKSINGVLVAVE